MSLTSTTPKVTYSTDGSTVAFDFTFSLATNLSGEIKVTLVDTSDDSETLLEEDTDYTVSAPNNDYSSGGTVTTAETYAAGYNIVIETGLGVKQETVLPYSGPLPAKTVESALDYVTRLIQQLILSAGVSSTEATTFIKTLLNDATAAEARATLDVLSFDDEVMVYDNEILFYDNEILVSI